VIVARIAARFGAGPRVRTEVNMQLPNLPVQVRKGWQAITGAFQGVLAGLGLLAIVFLAIEGGELVPRQNVAVFPKATAAEPQFDAATEAHPAPHQEHKVLASYLARRYRVASDATADLVGEAYSVGRAVGLDPLLILAVISVESRFNPIAESDMGAKGLMQVIPRFHAEKFVVHGGEEAALNPRTNILVGAQILKEYIHRSGSLEQGLQLYNGAPEDPARAYAQKVLSEKQRLEQALPRAARPSTAT